MVALTLTFNQTTSLSTGCMFKVKALGGAVTLTPNSADQFNNQVAATSVVLPQGATSEIVTNASRNLYASNLDYGKITYLADAWPGTPYAADDEFYKGSTIDTAGTRRTGATAWGTTVNGGSISNSITNGILTLITEHCLTSVGRLYAGNACGRGYIRGQNETQCCINNQQQSGYLLRHRCRGQRKWKTGNDCCRHQRERITVIRADNIGCQMGQRERLSGNCFPFTDLNITIPTFVYFKVQRTATILVYSFSRNGSNYIQLESHTITNYLTYTPNLIGVLANFSGGPSTTSTVTVDWFRRTQ